MTPGNRPEQTVLYGLVRHHLVPFEEQCRESYGRGLPKYVRDELRAYLDCGIHSKGFARAVCQDCGHELLVAFSCKKRGICPSCNGRRMCDTAARVTDFVLPEERLRQWVLSVPFELRIVLAKNPHALSACGRIFVEEIFRFQRQRAVLVGMAGVRGAAISFPQRFGGSPNLNVHYHVVVPDAFFYRDTAGVVRHQLLMKPSRSELEEITHNTTCRVLRWLRRHGHLEADDDESVALAPEVTPVDAFLQGSLGLGQLASLRKEFGQLHPVREELRDADSVSKRVRAGVFNIHAGTVAESRQERERLVRYCARPPFSLERMTLTPDEQVAYQLKNPIRGRTHRVLSPEAFLARLCALIPPPRHPLIRFHGVVAPNSAWRKEVIPARQPCEEGAPTIPALSPRQLLSPDGQTKAPAEPLPESPSRDPLAWSSTPIDWATLLKRVYDIDALACECGGRLRFRELVDDAAEAKEQLSDRGWPSVDTKPRETSPPNDRDFYDASVPDSDPRGPPQDCTAGPSTDDYLIDPIYED